MAINNGKSRETGNIGYTRQKTKRNKTKQEHNKDNYRDEQPGPHQNLGVNPGAHEG